MKTPFGPSLCPQSSSCTDTFFIMSGSEDFSVVLRELEGSVGLVSEEREGNRERLSTRSMAATIDGQEDTEESLDFGLQATSTCCL